MCERLKINDVPPYVADQPPLSGEFLNVEIRGLYLNDIDQKSFLFGNANATSLVALSSVIRNALSEIDPYFSNTLPPLIILPDFRQQSVDDMVKIVSTGTHMAEKHECVVELLELLEAIGVNLNDIVIEDKSISKSSYDPSFESHLDCVKDSKETSSILTPSEQMPPIYTPSGQTSSIYTPSIQKPSIYTSSEQTSSICTPSEQTSDIFTSGDQKPSIYTSSDQTSSIYSSSEKTTSIYAPIVFPSTSSDIFPHLSEILRQPSQMKLSPTFEPSPNLSGVAAFSIPQSPASNIFLGAFSEDSFHALSAENSVNSDVMLSSDDDSPEIVGELNINATRSGSSLPGISSRSAARRETDRSNSESPHRRCRRNFDCVRSLKRTLTSEQLKRLEMEYRISSGGLTRQRRSLLAIELNMCERQVLNWFLQRRARRNRLCTVKKQLESTSVLRQLLEGRPCSAGSANLRETSGFENMSTQWREANLQNESTPLREAENTQMREAIGFENVGGEWVENGGFENVGIEWREDGEFGVLPSQVETELSLPPVYLN